MSAAELETLYSSEIDRIERWRHEELERAGAYRVYEDPADLIRHLDEIGVRVPAR